MNTKANGKQNCEGMALVTVMMILVAVSALLAVTYKGSIQSVFMAHKLADRARAQAIAESGAHKAYSILVTNFAARMSDAEFPSTAYAGGSFDVTVTPVSNNMAIVSSVGRFGIATEQVILDVKNYGGLAGTSFGEELVDYAILCGGRFDFKGCGEISGTNGGARLHANGLVNITGSAQTGLNITSTTKIQIGNNKTINGSVRAPVLDYTVSKVTITGGATVGAVPAVIIPDLNLDPYAAWAASHSQVYNGLNLSGGTHNPAGGVMWVNGDVQISSHTVINGTIIATGNIHFSGQADITAGPSGIALASRDGSITYTSTGVASGLVYCKMGSYSQTANGRIEGQLIVKGNIDKGGNSDILVYNRTTLTPPDGSDATPDDIGVSAWQK